MPVDRLMDHILGRLIRFKRARVITNENGAVSCRRDYTAFGEESITSDRAAGLGYTGSQDGVRKGYTRYEKDTESGLDFAQARHYNSMHGRFTSADPPAASNSASHTTE